MICGARVMAELLLELFSEEIPARMQMRAAEDLARLLGDGLKGAGLSFDTVRSFATPRRLTVVVDGLPARSPDVSEEKKGPRVGAPDAAVQGFLKSAGLKSLEQADTRKLLEHFRDAEAECKALLAKGDDGKRHLMVLPAYDQAIKASHIFNLLDARGVISVTERQGFILRVRELARACCAAWLKTEAGGAHA